MFFKGIRVIWCCNGLLFIRANKGCMYIMFLLEIQTVIAITKPGIQRRRSYRRNSLVTFSFCHSGQLVRALCPGESIPLSQWCILHIPSPPRISAKCINLCYFRSFSFFGFPSTLTMMHLRVMLNTYWMPVVLHEAWRVLVQASPEAVTAHGPWLTIAQHHRICCAIVCTSELRI